ncbi:MAG: hypothetical protein R2729_07035 [Bryobacteraceae bacterium]
MSVQIFLQGKFTGVEGFVTAGVSPESEPAESVLTGRCRWISLLSDVLPRAILAELGLAKILLGWSGGGGFFLVVPEENLAAAEEILKAAAAEAAAKSGNRVRLVWGWTENLGDWITVRKRLTESLFMALNTAAAPGSDFFEPHAAAESNEDAAAFAELAAALPDAKIAGWDPAAPATVALGAGKHQWPIGQGDDAISVMRHTAPKAEGPGSATASEMAAQAEGRHGWGVLRADVDGFAARLRRVQSVEDYVQISLLYRQFFAGELELLCAMRGYWQRVTVLYSGGDDFAVYGAWDALLELGREMQRLFQRFAEANLHELPGPEGKTISMALELAGEEETLPAVYERAGKGLEAAKTAGHDCVRLFGAAIEWRQMQHTGQLKDILLRMVREFGCSPQILSELGGFYRDKPVESARPDRPWRYHRRLGLMLGEHKDRELLRLQKALITDIVGKSPTHVKLRPVGRVAVEWAWRLLEA